MNKDSRASCGPVEGRLAGKIALITGVGSGQGREVALLFAKAGALVIGCDINADGLAGTQDLARDMGVTLDLSVVDAADEAKVTSWADATAERYGGIDVLYNNGAGVHFAPFADMTLDQWHDTLRMELDTVFIPSRAVWRHMIARGGGSIVNIASIAGMRGSEVIGTAGPAAHATGKSGVIGFTRQLATEGAPHWIRVNAISPGPIFTPAVEQVVASSPEFRRMFDGMSMLSRFGFPIDVAYTGLFLASDESAFVTGANLTVDGGTTARTGASFLR
ncbi:SDR family oxidoreductase [Altericroceibacterium spongiae]|uniref:SDR family oxidoreductase n=1 Tax=Altericroceibacterium spongiae TaxID=2320269 RepID=A0A420EQY5_9SPHN|nr:SDR family NAD(P)-dependent oxidoreductase [Altericroceibacterium spongiae]RKF23098.1 SDR family oxidoreductase [Altericroceibacterium spongiae]